MSTTDRHTDRDALLPPIPALLPRRTKAVLERQREIQEGRSSEIRSPQGLLDRHGAPVLQRGGRQLEQRMVPVAEVRFATDDDPTASPGRFRAVVLRFGVVDDYWTVFTRDTFAESLATRMPRICWHHRWDQPVGRWVEAETTDTELILTGELDLDMIDGTSTPAVPLAHQARVQLRSGTIDQFSIGFLRLEDEDGTELYGKGVDIITKGILDEASLVLVGAVPGTHTVDAPRNAARGAMALSVRMPGQAQPGDPVAAVPLAEATRIILQMQNGDLDLADGLSALKAAAVIDTTATDTDTDGGAGGDGTGDHDDDAAAGQPGSADGTDPGGSNADGDAGAGAPPAPAAGENEPEGGQPGGDTTDADSGGGAAATSGGDTPDPVLAAIDEALEMIS